MGNEEDPKIVARKESQTPQVQRLLRQFLNTDGPKGNTEAHRVWWLRSFGEKTGEHAGVLCHGEDPGSGNPINECDDELCWCHPVVLP